MDDVRALKERAEMDDVGALKERAEMDDVVALKEMAKKIRKDVLDLAVKQNDGHIAPAYSTIEILVALYEKFLGNKDRFILSKGHGCLGLYVLLRYKGLNPAYSGHPDIQRDQGIECTTGSLGHGLPIGVGMAFAKKFKNERGNVYVLLGDGECQEGTIWESLNLAKRFKLDNLTIIVDHNKLQALGSVKDIMGEDNLASKFLAFGCNTIEADGHDFNDLLRCLDPGNKKLGEAKAIIAHTVKGNGISFMENDAGWHSRIPEGDLLEKAYRELE